MAWPRFIIFDRSRLIVAASNLTRAGYHGRIVALTDAELLEEVLVAPRRAYVRNPDLRVIDRPGFLQLVTPSLRDGGNNEVAYAQLGEVEADDVIDRVTEEYRALGVRWRWQVGPDSTPADLGERLARRGFVRSEVIGMARPTTEIAPVPSVDVERVGEVSVAVFSDVMARGWGMEPGPIATLNAHALADPERRHRLYLARLAGVPVGVAVACWFPRSVYLLGGVVLATHHHRGAYKALVAARLADAAAAGIEVATSHARPETSAPILARMGFREIVRFGSYALPRRG